MRFQVLIFDLCLLLLLPAAIFAQDSRFSSTVTGGVGASVPSGYLLNQFHSAPTFSGNLEFRLHKYLSAEIGVENMLPNYDYGAPPHNMLTTSRQRVTLMPYGLRAILPLANQRAELFAGAGGAYYWRSTDIDYSSMSGTLWQANAGGRFALDRGRHFWMGTTVRLYRDLGRPTQQWFSVTGDFGFRLGR